MFERINVEISNVCNLKCSFCPAVQRGTQILSTSNFSKILSKVGPYTKEVVLHLLGEPLGHPHFPEVLAVACEHNVPVNIVTNGVLMTGPRPELLLSPIVRQVSFSLHSFEANFKDQNPKVYLDRIKKFCEDATARRPDLYVNLRLWDLTSPEDSMGLAGPTLRTAVAEAFAFDWADVVVDLRRRKSWRIGGRIYLHFDSRFEWPNLAQSILQERGTCHALKGHIGIHADGTVVPCCLDHNADMPLGNIFQSSLEEILMSPRAQRMRRGFSEGDLTEELCKRCGFIERFSHKVRKEVGPRLNRGNSL